MDPRCLVPSGWQLELTDRCAKYAMKYFAWTMTPLEGRPAEPAAAGLPLDLAADIRAASKAMEAALANTGEFELPA